MLKKHSIDPTRRRWESLLGAQNGVDQVCESGGRVEACTAAEQIVYK